MRGETNKPAHSAPDLLRDDRLILERLQTFGLIEPNGHGGWRMTPHARAGLARVQHQDIAPEGPLQPSVIRPWSPRKLWG